MTRFTYNDAEFWLEPAARGWTVVRQTAGGTPAPIATGVFAGADAAAAECRARALVQVIVPVGIKLVGPDLGHGLRSGDLRLVGPDVAHPNFIAWNKDSTSFPKAL